MSRLTKYEPREYSMFPYQLKDDELSTKLDSIHKLGQLEDFEDELGCPLDVVFKALKEGIVVKLYIDKCDNSLTIYKPTFCDGFKEKYFEEVILANYDNVWCLKCANNSSIRPCVELKDYQDTWWLKGDRENDENE